MVGTLRSSANDAPVNYTRLPYGMLKGQAAVVTGASRGIGRAVCDLFAAQGAVVLACVRTPTEELEIWQQHWRSQDAKIELIRLDLTNEGSQKEAVNYIRSAGYKPTALVNCAGVASGATFAMTPQISLRQVFEANLFMQLSWCQLMARLLSRSPSSTIINMSSSAVHTIDAGTLVYGASKAALERMSLSMAVELASQGIRVNVIAPGVTDTEMAKQMDPKACSALIDRQLLKKAARPLDIANAALFLASDLASHVTGQVIHVDGGLI